MISTSLFQSANSEVLLTKINQLDVIEIKTPNATARVALQGAQVFHFQPLSSAASLIWTSPDEDFTLGKPIRGGIPICWPWFGPFEDNAESVQKTNAFNNNQKRAHGAIRNAIWELKDIAPSDNGTIEVNFMLDKSKVMELTGFSAALELSVRVGSSLRTNFTVTNHSRNTLNYTAALHTYLATPNISTTEIIGFENIPYLDGLTKRRSIERDVKFRISKETEVVFFAPADCRIINSLDCNEIVLHSEGSQSTMIWNPWIEKSKHLGNFPNDAYKEMLCIETANIFEDLVSLDQNKTHSLAVTISI